MIVVPHAKGDGEEKEMMFVLHDCVPPPTGPWIPKGRAIRVGGNDVWGGGFGEFSDGGFLEIVFFLF